MALISMNRNAWTLQSEMTVGCVHDYSVSNSWKSTVSMEWDEVKQNKVEYIGFKDDVGGVSLDEGSGAHSLHVGC